MMKALLPALLLLASAGLAQCSDYQSKAASQASSCDFHSILAGQPNVYHCFEAGKSYLDAAECVSAAGQDASQYYNLALYYLENSIPKLSEEGDHPAKARAYENIGRAYEDMSQLDLARQNYELAVNEYTLSKEPWEADRVRRIIETLGSGGENESTGAGVIRREDGAGGLNYYFTIVVSASILALFLLVSARARKRRAPRVIIKHEPVKKAESRPPEKPPEKPSPRERAKEKLRRKYAPKK